jgi:hypothetical protein
MSLIPFAPFRFESVAVASRPLQLISEVFTADEPEARDEILIHFVLSAPYTVIQRAMHIHPTVTELIPTMLGELKPLECRTSLDANVKY